MPAPYRFRARIKHPTGYDEGLAVEVPADVPTRLVGTHLGPFFEAVERYGPSEVEPGTPNRRGQSYVALARSAARRPALPSSIPQATYRPLAKEPRSLLGKPVTARYRVRAYTGAGDVAGDIPAGAVGHYVDQAGPSTMWAFFPGHGFGQIHWKEYA